MASNHLRFATFLMAFIAFNLGSETNLQGTTITTYEGVPVTLEFPKDTKFPIYKEDVVYDTFDWENVKENVAMCVKGKTLQLNFDSPVAADKGTYSHNGKAIELIVKSSPSTEVTAATTGATTGATTAATTAANDGNTHEAPKEISAYKWTEVLTIVLLVLLSFDVSARRLKPTITAVYIRICNRLKPFPSQAVGSPEGETSVLMLDMEERNQILQQPIETTDQMLAIEKRINQKLEELAKKNQSLENKIDSLYGHLVNFFKSSKKNVSDQPFLQDTQVETIDSEQSMS